MDDAPLPSSRPSERDRARLTSSARDSSRIRAKNNNQSLIIHTFITCYIRIRRVYVIKLTLFWRPPKPRRASFRRHSTSRVRVGVGILAFACEGFARRRSSGFIADRDGVSRRRRSNLTRIRIESLNLE